MTITIKDLWLDGNQGETSGKAFGYIGTNEEYEDEEGDSVEFCGWFFDWPSSDPRITSEAERQAVIDSLNTDETNRHNEAIPHELAVEKLTAYLAKKFPATLTPPKTLK